tara:strand:- start:1255 stop:1734 length:480 start_codon:yes stop_codon:yes gene_type:complete
MATRSGIGVDFHRLEEGVDLTLGGVLVDSDKGSVGHSDGDALIHSIADALLGASNLGDLGKFFPSNDNKYKGAESRVFLDHILKIISPSYDIVNIDSTIILQAPQIGDLVYKMQSNIAQILSLDPFQVSVKATTTDYLGFIGSGDGVGALAIVQLKEKQ